MGTSGQSPLVAGKELLSESKWANGPSVKHGNLAPQPVKADAALAGGQRPKHFLILIIFSLHDRTFGRLSDGTPGVLSLIRPPPPGQGAPTIEKDRLNMGRAAGKISSIEQIRRTDE